MSADAKREAPMRKDLFEHLRRRDGVILAVALLITAGVVAAAIRVNGYQSVWLVNGLSVPMIVEIDGAKTELAAGARVEKLFSDGAHRARVLGASGEVLDDAPIDVDASQSAVIYNVLGAAPLYAEVVRYSASPSAGSKDDVTFLGGERLVTRPHVDYLFEEPPASIEIKRGESSVRQRLDQAKGSWLGTAHYLAREGQQPIKAAKLARAAARAQPGDAEAQAWALRYTELAEGFDAAVAFLREQRDLRPGDMEAHRGYQYAMIRAGRADELRAEYRERRAKEPASVDAAVLLARAEAPDAAQALYGEVIAAHPDHAPALLGAALLAFQNRRWADADALYAKAANDPLYARHLDNHAAALVALGRAPEALDRLSRALSQEANQDLPTALLYARIARLPDAGPTQLDALAPLKQLASKPGFAAAFAWARSVLGDDPGADLANAKEPDLQTAAQIHLAALNDPAEAWAICAAAYSTALDRLDATFATLLAAEFARVGDRALAERLIGPRFEVTIPPGALLDYATTGAEPPELWRVDPELRAMLDFVRARALDDRGDTKAAAALYAAAEQAAPLKDLIPRLRKAWPAPGSAAETALLGALSDSSKAAGVLGGVVRGKVDLATKTASSNKGGLVGGIVERKPGKFVVLRKQPGG